MTKLIRNISIAAVVMILAACASEPSSPGVGVWNMNIVTPMGEQASMWTISADGTGNMSGDQGDQALDGIMLEGNTVSFAVSIDAGGQSLNLSYTGTVEGDSLNGEFSSDFGPIEASGTRQ